MSFFVCIKCKNLRDSDDGAEARYSREEPYEKSARFSGLICSDCLDEEPETPDGLPQDFGAGEI